MLKQSEHDQVLHIQMNRPPANAMNLELVEVLTATHHEACAGEARAIVISGLEGMFSGGLDVPELLPLGRLEILEFWQAFFRLTQNVANSPVPGIAAVTGQIPAGGAVLAIHCDYRVAASGRFKIGLNEVQVGLPVPYTILQAFERLIGAQRATMLATQGSLIGPEEALAIGLVDELAEPELVVPQAIAKAEALVALPPIAMNQTRLQSRKAFLELLKDNDDAEVATDYWFSDETQQSMHALVESLRK
jgi:3,2-trans-enoyl-CoA isomerase